MEDAKHERNPVRTSLDHVESAIAAETRKKISPLSSGSQWLLRCWVVGLYSGCSTTSLCESIVVDIWLQLQLLHCLLKVPLYVCVCVHPTLDTQYLPSVYSILLVHQGAFF